MREGTPGLRSSARAAGDALLETQGYDAVTGTSRRCAAGPSPEHRPEAGRSVRRLTGGAPATDGPELGRTRVTSVVLLLAAAVAGTAFSLRRVLRIDPASAIGTAARRGR